MRAIYDLPKLSEYAKKMEDEGYIDPMSIIMHYAIDTNQEYVLMDIIVKTAKARAEKAETQLNYARSWIPNKIDFKQADKRLSDKTIKLLNRLVDIFCLGMDIPKSFIEEVRETIGNMNTPNLIFVPMVDWLRKEYNIRFKDDTGEEK